MLRRVGTCCVLVVSYDVSYAFLSIYIYIWHPATSQWLPMVTDIHNWTMGQFSVLLGAVLFFAGHADTDTYWTSKISSGRGSKCSGKNSNMAWKIKGSYRRSTLQQRSCCEMSGGNWLFSNDRKLGFNYQWLRFHHGKCELKGNMAVTPHTRRCFPARRVQKGAAMVFTDQHGNIAATIPEYINWSTVGFAQCQEQCPLTDRKMGVINVKLKLHDIGWIPRIIEV